MVHDRQAAVAAPPPLSDRQPGRSGSETDSALAVGYEAVERISEFEGVQQPRPSWLVYDAQF
jgi:hypothetical protein